MCVAPCKAHCWALLTFPPCLCLSSEPESESPCQLQLCSGTDGRMEDGRCLVERLPVGQHGTVRFRLAPEDSAGALAAPTTEAISAADSHTQPAGSWFSKITQSAGMDAADHEEDEDLPAPDLATEEKSTVQSRQSAALDGDSTARHVGPVLGPPSWPDEEQGANQEHNPPPVPSRALAPGSLAAVPDAADKFDMEAWQGGQSAQAVLSGCHTERGQSSSPADHSSASAQNLHLRLEETPAPSTSARQPSLCTSSQPLSYPFLDASLSSASSDLHGPAQDAETSRAAYSTLLAAKQTMQARVSRTDCAGEQELVQQHESTDTMMDAHSFPAVPSEHNSSQVWHLVPNKVRTLQCSQPCVHLEHYCIMCLETLRVDASAWSLPEDSLEHMRKLCISFTTLVLCSCCKEFFCASYYWSSQS